MILEIPGTTTFKQIIPKYTEKSMSVTTIAKNEKMKMKSHLPKIFAYSLPHFQFFFLIL